MTLKGAGKLLAEQGVGSVLGGEARIVAPADSVMLHRSISPAREMQETVRKAFEAATPDTPASGTQERLETILSDLTDLQGPPGRGTPEEGGLITKTPLFPLPIL